MRKPNRPACIVSLVFLLALCVSCGGVVSTSAPDKPAGGGGAADDPDGVGSGGAGAGGSGGATCGEQAFHIEQAIPDMLIVLDRSYSMSEGGSPTLWDMSRTAIHDITTTMDRQIWFGLYVFPSGSSPYSCNDYDSDCKATGNALVPVGDAASGAINSALSSMQACGSGTPTAAALTMAGQYLQGLPQNGHARAILLVTDGGPNCNASLNPQSCVCSYGTTCWYAEDCLDDAATNQALDSLRAAGVKTYVLGLGAAQSLSSVLASLAQHGGTSTPYAANDPASVKSAFSAITSGVASCSFEVDCTKIQDVNKVNFYFDGTVVPQSASHQSGWDWTTPCQAGSGKGTVEFFGADCTSIKGSSVKTVSARFGCATIIE